MLRLVAAFGWLARTGGGGGRPPAGDRRGAVLCCHLPTRMWAAARVTGAFGWGRGGARPHPVAGERAQRGSIRAAGQAGIGSGPAVSRRASRRDEGTTEAFWPAPDRFPSFHPRMTRWGKAHPVRFTDHHQRRATALVQDNYKVMVEVRDARLPLSSRHPAFANWAREAGGTSVIVYTHADLLTPAEVAAVCEWTEGSLEIPPAVFFTNMANAVNTKSQEGKMTGWSPTTKYGRTRPEGGESTATRCLQVRALRDAVVHAAVAHRVDRAAVVGLPNVGKSSLITSLTRGPTLRQKKKGAYHLPQVANVPGQTKAVKVHWLTEAPARFLLDMPGVCPPPAHTDRDPEVFYRFYLAEVVPSHASQPVLDVAEYALWLLNTMRRFEYVTVLGMEGPTEDIGVALQHMARPCLNVANCPLSIQQAAQHWIEMMRTGQLGSAMLDRLPPLDPGTLLPTLDRGSPLLYWNAVAEDLVHNRRVAVNPQTQRPASSRLIHASRDREFEPSPLPEGGSEL